MAVEYEKEHWGLEFAHDCWNCGTGNSLYRRNPDMAWDLKVVS
jgi:hypothetical protein